MVPIRPGRPPSSSPESLEWHRKRHNRLSRKGQNLWLVVKEGLKEGKPYQMVLPSHYRAESKRLMFTRWVARHRDEWPALRRFHSSVEANVLYLWFEDWEV